MERLFIVTGVIFLATILLCWVVTSDWMAPAGGLLLFLAGTLLIGIWGMSVLESGKE